MEFQKGDLVRLGGKRLCVVVGTDLDDGVPEAHLAVWFGSADDVQTAPEVWTVPADQFEKASPPIVKH